MDSLTQIVLGAAVGEAVLGKKIGNKAILYGAIAGTIPDLDVLTSHFTDTVTALSLHRGFTHSLVFTTLFAPLFGWIVSRYESYKNRKDWSWLFFWGFVTHALLDAHTTWGTQLFWPFKPRIALKTIFVIDPLYTVPFLTCVTITMMHKRTSKKRQFYNNLGLLLSSGYLVLTYFLKWIAFEKFESALLEQKINYTQLDTRPSPLNTILWSANVDTENYYLLGHYSFFDSKPITFEAYPKNHQLINKYLKNDKMKDMIAISEGWYTITKTKDTLYYNDLRFGLYSMNTKAQDFVFKYKIEENTNGALYFIEAPKNKLNGKKMMSNLWLRIKGN